MITEKKIVFIECEHCGGSFDSEHIHFYKEADAAYCDSCAEKLEAAYA